MTKLAQDVARLSNLAVAIIDRREPLGVGLKNQCFAGLAVDLAREQSTNPPSDFYGLSKGVWKHSIKTNNRTPSKWRNLRMAAHVVWRLIPLRIAGSIASRT